MDYDQGPTSLEVGEPKTMDKIYTEGTVGWVGFLLGGVLQVQTRRKGDTGGSTHSPNDHILRLGKPFCVK